MACKINTTRDSTGNIIIRLAGFLEYQSSSILRENLEDIFDVFKQNKIQIDMAGVRFVGSSGICHFVETLKSIQRDYSKKLFLVNVDLDFKKVFLLYGLKDQHVSIRDFSLNSDIDKERRI